MSISVDIDEAGILSFFNLCIRYALGLGAMGREKSELRKIKTQMTKNVDEVKRALKAVQSIARDDDEVNDTREDLEEKLKKAEATREYIDLFIQKEHYVTLIEGSQIEGEDGEKVLAEYLGELSGMVNGEHEEWDEIEIALRKKKENRIKNSRKKMEEKLTDTHKLIMKLPEDKSMWTSDQLKKTDKIVGKNSLSGRETIAKLRSSVLDPNGMSDEEIMETLRADVTDLGGKPHVQLIVRTLAWNFFYWKLAPFVCMRDTSTLRSTSLDSEETPVFGYKSVYVPGNKRRKRTVVMEKKISKPKTIALELK